MLPLPLFTPFRTVTPRLRKHFQIIAWEFISNLSFQTDYCWVDQAILDSHKIYELSLLDSKLSQESDSLLRLTAYRSTQRQVSVDICSVEGSYCLSYVFDVNQKSALGFS